MNAIDTIELGLEAFNSSHLQNNARGDIAGEFGLGSAQANGFKNQAPVIVQPLSFATGSVALGNTARATVLASDNGGEAGLLYRWSVIRSPIGSSVIFSANNSNSAKNVTLSFDRAGEYEIMATTVDNGGLTASSSARLTVIQTLTSLQVSSADGKVVNPSIPFNTAAVDPAFRVRGVDQFGQVMNQSLPVIWTMRTGPANARMTQVAQGDFTRFQFSHFDQYGLQATVGDRVLRFNVQNVRASARMDLIDSSGSLILDGTTVAVSSDRSIVNMRVFDQQGNIVNSPTNIAWTTRIAPSGGTARVTLNGTQATIVFNRVGTYELSAQANGLSRIVRFQVNPVLTSLALTPSGVSVQAGQTRQFTAQGMDQFGVALVTAPTVTWTASGGTISTSGLFTAGQLAGPGTVIAASGSVRSTIQVTITSPTVVTNSLQLRDASGNVLRDTNPVTVTGTQIRVDPRIVNSTGGIVNSAPMVSMSITSAPASGNATFSMSGSTGNIQFTRAGIYDLNFTSSGMTRRLRVTVSATLTSLQITPGTASVQTGQTRQFSIAGVDQFGQTMASPPAVTWTATGGTVSSSGLFTASNTAGSGSVRATAGAVSATAAITVTAPPIGPFQNAALSQLIQTYYADQMLSRTEVMAILRSVGSDSVVDTTELNDLRTLVNSTQYVMPAHVRGLARNTVTDNPANLRFQGQTAGNLAAGANSTLLNRLVDKWFLGVDLPTVTVPSLAYSSATGTLFNVGPSLADVKQGMVGDCYFLAAVGSIADRNQQAIRDIFDDNGDGTFTVRFFGRNSSGIATADYVTVDRRLPTYSGVYLYYAGYGFTTNSPSTVLWVALAEKAYAQWNETGRAGRDGTNSYAGIEAGWMSDVNFQILGYNSTNYNFATTPQQTLITALANGQAVTAGTKTTVANGLVATHAYSIRAYNNSTGRFTLHNPWGNTHPAPLTWAELQTNFSMFTTTAPQGSGGDVVSSGFRSQRMVIGGAATAPASLLHRSDVGMETIESDQTQHLGTRQAEMFAMAWLEQDLSRQTIASDILNPSIEDSSEDSEIEFNQTSNRLLKDLALMDLYITAALR